MRGLIILALTGLISAQPRIMPLIEVHEVRSFGDLLNDKTACVSVTGCAGQDNLEFTINSVNSGPSNMYILHKNGNLEMVESAFMDERVRSEAMRVPRENGEFHLKGDDEMVNDAEA